MATDEHAKASTSAQAKPTCGIVMPISEIDGCSAGHWKDVRGIIIEAAMLAGFTASLVSESDDIGVIQQRIVQNLYDCDVIICDVSAKNANVMFELGLRLAFDKPAIVLKDDKTSYSFDTSPIEHVEYPRDLRYSEIQSFKDRLAAKIKATFEASKKPEFTTFLKHFGKFRVSGIETQEVSAQDFLNKELLEIKSLLSSVARGTERGFRSRLPVGSINEPNSETFGEIISVILNGVEAGRITKEELSDPSPILYAFVFEKDPELLDSYGSPREFERNVAFAARIVLSAQTPREAKKQKRTATSLL